MTNTLKHLALLARMESSGLKLGLTGKFPEDALDQTCERVETFQLQNRLRTGNDNTQIQKELVRTPEFAALYHALCNDGVDDRSITSMLQSAVACDEQLTQYPKEQVLAAAGTDIPLSLRFYYMKFYLPFIKYEEEGEAIIDNINAFPATEREELSALTDAQKNMMRQPFLGPYLFNWNNNTREALELLEQNQPLQRVLTLLYRQGVALDLNAARLKDLCWVETADVMKFRRLLAAGFADTFRTLHPEEITYSWWSYRFHAREKNAGWRIDYFIVSRRLLPRVTEAAIRTEVYGSDHCPVVLEIS